MRACWLKWVGRDWSISADYIWLNYSGANTTHGGNRARIEIKINQSAARVKVNRSVDAVPALRTQESNRIVINKSSLNAHTMHASTYSASDKEVLNHKHLYSSSLIARIRIYQSILNLIQRL